jgi:predicted acyl esterase
VTLQVTDTADDGDFFVYLEEVMPDGRVFMVSEGQLRASMRTGELPYKTLAPTAVGTRASQSSGLAGEPLSLEISLIPFAHQFAGGSRLRIAIAGSNKANFAVASGNRRWTVQLGANGSGLTLPEFRP